LANLAYFQGKWAGLAVSCCLAGSSKKAPKIFIFSIAMGYSFELNSIETQATPFFGHNNLFLGEVKKSQEKLVSSFMDGPF
jgi:hypothetical protein